MKKERKEKETTTIMHTTNHTQQSPYRFMGYLLLIIAVVALVGICIPNRCPTCGCTLQSRLKSFVTANNNKKKHAKSVNPIFVPPTTTGAQPSVDKNQDSGLDEKIPLFLDYPTPAAHPPTAF